MPPVNDNNEEPRAKAWRQYKSEVSFEGSMGREKITELFGFIDELRADVRRLKAAQKDLEAETGQNTADLTYIKTVLDGDRLLGPGIFERLDKTQKSLDEQQKSIEQITRKVDLSAVISQQNQELSRQLSLQLKLLIIVFVLLFVLLLFYVVAIYI